MRGSDSISPTALYTGYVWSRNGLSTPELTTNEGRVMFESLHPLMVVSGKFGRPSLEAYLLARHRAIDALLERAIERDQITQVIEVAAGLSPRGWRFAQRYQDRITYVEADLPAMAARKREALERAGSLPEQHQVRDLDVLQENGLTELADGLDRQRGLAIITEGLLGYISPGDMNSLWRRFAATLTRFSAGRYISDLHLANAQTIEVRAFRIVLSAFVRGQVYLHFSDAAEAEAALRATGFASVTVRPANAITGERRGRGAQMAHILEASTV